MTEARRAAQEERLREEGEQARDASTEDEADQHGRRADKAARAERWRTSTNIAEQCRL